MEWVQRWGGYRGKLYLVSQIGVEEDIVINAFTIITHRIIIEVFLFKMFMKSFLCVAWVLGRFTHLLVQIVRLDKLRKIYFMKDFHSRMNKTTIVKKTHERILNNSFKIEHLFHDRHPVYY